MVIEKEYTLKLSTEQAQANIDELNQSLKLQEDLIEDIEKEIRDYEKQINKTSARDLAQRKSLNDKIQKTKERLKDEKVALKSVNKDRKEANATMKDSTANAKDYSGVLGIIDQKTGGAISGFTNLTGSVGGATKGFNFLKIAIIGTGIGALLIAITAVTAAFTSSEEGQNKFAKILAVVGSVVGNLVTMLSDLGEGIISVFENPKQAIIDLKNLIIENITNRITSLIDTFGFLGSAIKKVFSGDFAGAMDDAKSAGSSYIDTMTGVKDTINKVSGAVSDLTNELIREGKIAAGIADQRAKADKLDRDLIIERANANRDRADLLNKAADRENKNVQEKIGFLKEAGKIEEDITNKEIAAAQLRLTAKKQENELANSTKDDLLEEANLKARLIDLETAKLRKAKLVTTQIATLTAEARATEEAAQAIIDKKAEEDILKAASDEEKRILAIKAITDKYKLESDLTELEQLEIDEEKRLVALELLNATEEEKAQVRAFYAEKKVDAIQKAADEEERIQTALNDAKKELQSENLNNIAAGFSLLGQLAGKNKALQATAIIGEAAVSIAKTVISTQAANAIITAEGAALAIPSLGVSVGTAASLVAANNISAGISIAGQAAATATALSALGKGGAPPQQQVPTPTPMNAPDLSQPPAFNIVGQSDTNQLADAIGGQSQQPIQAFVVANEITTAQELERNIIDGATIG